MRTDVNIFTVEADVDYSHVVDDSETVEYEVHVPNTITEEEDVDFFLAEEVRRIFLKEHQLDDILEIDVILISSGNQGPLTPTKVMQLEGVKKLFPDE